MRWHFLITRSLWPLSRMCFRTISLRGARCHRLSLAPATKVTREQTPRARKKSPLFELARVLVCLDHVASGVVNAELQRGVFGCEPCLRNALALAMAQDEETIHQTRRVDDKRRADRVRRTSPGPYRTSFYNTLRRSAANNCAQGC